MAERARFVQIDSDRIQRYAAALPIDEIRNAAAIDLPRLRPSPEALAAFVLTLDAINFGSGYFPHLRRRPGKSGYRTLEACLREHFEQAGPLGPAELRRMTAARCAELLGQSPDSPEIAELLDLYARSWRDLGTLVEQRYAGSFGRLVADAAGSAAALVRILLEMPLYRDISRYEDFQVPFLKRAQISVADLALVLPEGPGRFHDLDQLTAFADNLIPHVLRLDGVLHYDPELQARIEREELIPAGSPEEVEIRACAVHAVELLTAELERRSIPIAPRQLDAWLWERGGRPEYKARPRHRTRSPFY